MEEGDLFSVIDKAFERSGLPKWSSEASPLTKLLQPSSAAEAAKPVA